MQKKCAVNAHATWTTLAVLRVWVTCALSSFIPGQCCPIPGCLIGPDTRYPVHQQKYRLSAGSVGQHWVNTHAEQAYAAFCRQCSFVSLLDSSMKNHLDTEHSIVHYKKTDEETSETKPSRGNAGNLHDRKALLSRHVVIHKIIVSLGQRYGGIRGANTYVSPRGLGVLWARY